MTASDDDAPAGPPRGSGDLVRVVTAYHERTKHDYGRFARALGYLDWDTQPDPFRRYADARLTELVLPDEVPAVSYDQLYHTRRDAGGFTSRAVDLSALSLFFFHSMALSAWKSIETARWSLRVNPSSGNLHPTEGWLLAPAVPSLSSDPGLYHYAPREHALERRALIDEDAWTRLSVGLPPGAFLVALSSVAWRESWKYGERAWRYCQHDAGHALGALRFAAALLGWRLVALPHVPDEALEQVLGLDRTGDFHDDEPEVPDLLAVVWPGAVPFDPRTYELTPRAVQAVRSGVWSGPSNRLSPDHHPWPVIDEIERACRKSPDWCARKQLTVPRLAPAHPRPPETDADVPDAARIIRQRRSAVAMDARTGLTREGLYHILSRCVPALTESPWDAVCWPTLVHLGLFVHRVGGLPPGLYVLAREASARDRLQRAMDDTFLWERPESCPAELPFYLLREGDARSLAASVSCGQDIAADGAFSLGMLADFERALDAYGAPVYRHLFWETGVIGQVLYLEAEALGVRSTGIGCFFDDPVHAAFGLRDRTFQSLYHFTVGGAVDDTRLTSEPAYPDRSTTD